MIIVTQHTLSKSMLDILSNYKNYTQQFNVLREKMKIEKCKILTYNLYNQKKICFTHENFTAGVDLWINVTESTPSN